MWKILRPTLRYDMDTNPMKPITRKNMGKNWTKQSDSKYKPHIGNKQKSKAVNRKLTT
jgi:hypothetical protein